MTLPSHEASGLPLHESPAELSEYGHATQERAVDIKTDAHEQLEKWGLQRPQIERLAGLLSAYEYGCCPEKAQAVVRRGGLLAEENGKEILVLPEYYDYAGDRTMGQCSELAVKTMRDLYHSGWLEEVNASLTAAGKEPLVPYSLEGLSRTHFNEPGWNHVWAGVAPRGVAAGEIVTLDASFGEVSLGETNGYVPQTIHEGVESMDGLSEAATIDVGMIGFNEQGLYISGVSRSITIGATTDRRCAFLAGYARWDDDAKTMRPFLAVRPDFGSNQYCYMDAKGEIAWVHTNTDIGESNRREAEAVLTSLNSLLVAADQGRAEAIRDRRQVVSLKPA